MSKIKCKGTVLKQEIGSTATAVAQVISLSWSGAESQTYEADTLDNANAGIPYETTGRTEGGSLSGELFLDPALSGHKSLLALLTTPADENWTIQFADTGTTSWTFTGAGFGMGAAVALADGLKADFSIKIDGLPTFPA